jgi:hypothetical protein
LGRGDERFDSFILDMDKYQENALDALANAKDIKEEAKIIKDLVLYEKNVKDDPNMKKKK